MKTMMAVAALLAAGGSAWAQDAAAPVVWGNAEVDAYVEANRPRTGAAAGDPFTAPPAAVAPAGQMLLRYPLYRKDTEPGFKVLKSATWSYDPAKQEMTVRVGKISDGALLNMNAQGIDIGRPSYSINIAALNTNSNRETSDAGTGQNAYGARVEMTRVAIEERGVGELTRSILDDVGPSLPSGTFYYEHTWAIPAEEARALSTNLEVQIEATSVAWAPDKWVMCGSHYSGATVTRPTILVVNGCYLTVQFQNIRVVDTRDGTVIKEWIRSASRRR